VVSVIGVSIAPWLKSANFTRRGANFHHVFGRDPEICALDHWRGEQTVSMDQGIRR
jgi:hypothetical protein